MVMTIKAIVNRIGLELEGFFRELTWTVFDYREFGCHYIKKKKQNKRMRQHFLRFSRLQRGRNYCAQGKLANFLDSFFYYQRNNLN